MRLTTRYTTAGTAMRGECFATRRRCSRSAPALPLAPKFRGDVEELWMWRAVIITLNPIFISSFTASTAFLLNCSLMTPTA